MYECFLKNRTAVGDTVGYSHHDVMTSVYKLKGHEMRLPPTVFEENKIVLGICENI